MEILILNWRDIFHPLAGGAEISLLEHAKIWQKKGATITWFTSYSAHTKKDETVEGIRYIRKGNTFTVHLHFLFYALSGKVKNVDVLIDSFHFIPFFTPLFVKQKKIIALINEVAGNLWYANLPYPLAWLGDHLEPYIFRLYRGIPFITGSESAKDDLVNHGVSATQIAVIPHGMTPHDVSASVKKEQIPILLFFGRISKDKGIQDILEAFLSLKKMNLHLTHQIQLWIVGKEEKIGYLKELLSSKYHEFENDITYFGYVDENKKFELMKRATLLLHASMKEGWGLTVIEAGTQGTPTIGYNVPGLRDSIRDGETGILVEPNSNALTTAIIKVLQDKKTYNRLVTNVITWSQQFDWEKSGEKSWRYITQ